MSKHRKPYHPETVKRAEAESGKTVEELDSPEAMAAAVDATFNKPDQPDLTFKVAVDMGDPNDPESAASLLMFDPLVNPRPPTEAERIQARAALVERKLKALPHEEYLVGECHRGDLQLTLRENADEGRWRLHTIDLTGTFCKYVLVRAKGDWSENP